MVPFTLKLIMTLLFTKIDKMNVKIKIFKGYTLKKNLLTVE